MQRFNGIEIITQKQQAREIKILTNLQKYTLEMSALDVVISLIRGI